ncbi:MULTISPECIES: peptidylprolyl isomerase [unclassified Sphingobium]|uniref:peptidylprolyl isomerase n=1 Tax=unclassified Sphingobium TaxID=2611147 RepID=UPI002225541C|nr:MULTISPECIES: peptidylprolyl isomerase [unclassified Sphingobium]MCW2395588.1 peptidylprolyl isomerase [Sphingobium sp. B8D3B]MCW2419103.1 peptidylprolyl isomerase [Sphingobium sp. B8D3C]
MRVTRLFGSGIALAAACGLMLASANSAQAQPGGGAQDALAKAEMAARAQKDADALREDAEKSTDKPLVAMTPVTPENTWVLTLSDGATVRILLRPDVAPGHVERIKTLTREGFYNGLKFHRVIDGFMAQGGDPKGDGTGGSPLPDLKQEFSWLPHMRGTVSMARAQSDDSANSQFFIMLMPRMQLDHKYTVVGRVIDGMAGVDKIAKGEPPAQPTTIVRAYIQSDQQAAAPAGSDTAG